MKVSFHSKRSMILHVLLITYHLYKYQFQFVDLIAMQLYFMFGLKEMKITVNVDCEQTRFVNC